MSNITEIVEPLKEYDHRGAAVYIAVILIWYSTGLAMMLFLQVRPRSIQQQFLLDSSDPSTKKRLQTLSNNPLTNYQNIQADNNTKQILNELKDPARRQRLWKIYYASAEKHDEPYPKYYQTITADTAAIDRIKRKLANIHRMNDAQDDSGLLSPSMASSNENRATTSSFDSTKFFSKRFPSLRRPTAMPPGTAARPQFLRALSQNDTSAPEAAVEMESLLSPSGSPFVSSEPGSPMYIPSKLSDRFTVEKVPERNTVLPEGNDAGTNQ